MVNFDFLLSINPPSGNNVFWASLASGEVPVKDAAGSQKHLIIQRLVKNTSPLTNNSFDRHNKERLSTRQPC